MKLQASVLPLMLLAAIYGPNQVVTSASRPLRGQGSIRGARHRKYFDTEHGGAAMSAQKSLPKQPLAGDKNVDQANTAVNEPETATASAPRAARGESSSLRTAHHLPSLNDGNAGTYMGTQKGRRNKQRLARVLDDQPVERKGRRPRGQEELKESA